MAKIESILGKITGTVGDLTFRHQSGTRSTISAKASKVSNPKSIAQNTQRMKIRPAQLFYNAFQSVLNHSREGVNPRTKERMMIPACKCPSFKAGKALKIAVNAD